MRILISFIIFVIAFISFNWVMKRIEIHEKILNKARKVKYYNFTLACIFFLFMFLLEYGKHSLYELCGRDNWISIAFSGILGSIYINFIPFIFKRS